MVSDHSVRNHAAGETATSDRSAIKTSEVAGVRSALKVPNMKCPRKSKVELRNTDGERARHTQIYKMDPLACDGWLTRARF